MAEDGGAESKNGLEEISKGLATVLVAVYFLGFLVVTRHLSQYGVSPNAILKLQYLMAGVWLLAALVWPCLFIGAVSVMNLFSTEEHKKLSPFRQMFTWTGLLEMAILVVPFAIAVIVLARFWFGSIEDAFYFFDSVFLQHFLTWVGFFAGTVGLSVATVYTVLFAKKQDEEKRLRYRILAFYLGALSFLILLWYVSYFARTWYPLIPYRIGGGRPISVVFLLKAEEGHKQLPVVPDTSGERSIPYKMLFETEKTFVVLSPKAEEQAIEFERDAVLGVVVLKEVPSSKFGVVRQLSEVKFPPGEGPNCLQFFLENGDLKTGPSTAIMKAQPKCVVPPHYHTAEEQLIIVRGDVSTGMQGMPDTVLGPGGFAMMPSKLPHWFTCTAKEECLMFVTFDRPYDIVWLKSNNNK